MINPLHKRFWFILLASLSLVAACRKNPKPIIYSGQLLLSKKYPIPVSNKKIEIYQQGQSSAIGLGSGAASIHVRNLYCFNFV
jgi:hypothetical protein